MIYVFRSPQDTVQYSKFPAGKLPDPISLYDVTLSNSAIMGASFIAYQMEPHNPKSDFYILKNRGGTGKMKRVTRAVFKEELDLNLGRLGLYNG